MKQCHGECFVFKLLVECRRSSVHQDQYGIDDIGAEENRRLEARKIGSKCTNNCSCSYTVEMSVRRRTKEPKTMKNCHMSPSVFRGQRVHFFEYFLF
jgi:hypothetical protein